MYKRVDLVLLLTLFVVLPILFTLSCELSTYSRESSPVPIGITKEELARVGTISEEIIGPSPSSTHLRRVTYIPNGSSWNIMIPYSKEYVGPGSVTSFNVTAKDVKNVTLGYIPSYAAAPGDPVYDIKYATRLGLRRFVYRDKVVMPLQTKYQNDIILTYNIGSNSFEVPFLIPHDGFRMLVADANAEGVIRASGSENGSLRCYQYDPSTKVLTMSTPYPVDNRELSDYCYEMTRAVGDWIIVGWGGYPWRLIGYNFKTRQWKKLLEIRGKGSYKTFRLYKQKDQTILIYSQDVFDDPATNRYWRFTPTDAGDFSPSDVKDKGDLDLHPLQELYPSLDSTYYHRLVSAATAPPLVDEASALPDIDGRVELKYSYNGRDETLVTQISPFQTRCQIVGTAGDYLYGAGDAYGQHIFYNMKTGQQHKFDGQEISVYSMKTIGDKVYVAGYPNFILREYDIPTMTMKNLGHNKYVQTHHPIAGIEQGIDGKIYYAGQYYRTREGGGIAWYDPATGGMGGLPIDKYRPFWMASIREGRFMVMSCKEDGGRLAVYSVESGKLAIFPVEGLLPGHIIGVGNHVIGYGISEEEGPVIYRMDPLTAEIVWKVKVPYAPVTAVSLVRKRAYVLTYDGSSSVYMALDRYLVKVNIDTGRIEALGYLPSMFNLTIYNGEFYQAGRMGFAKLTLP